MAPFAKHVLEVVVYVAIDTEVKLLATSSVMYGRHARGPRSRHPHLRCFLMHKSFSNRLHVLVVSLDRGSAY